MTNANSNATPARFDVRPTASDHFSWIRTRLSIERTLMSWVRTAISLIGFGFTIVQFFDRLGSMPGAEAARFPDAPRYMGLMLIGCGIIALLVSIWQYLFTIRYLRSGGFSVIAMPDDERFQTPLLAVSIALLLIGVFAFCAVFFRLL
jgi:putative membrane protein